MRDCVDFHAHTYYSDGAVSPAELARLGEEKRLAALAITDHDTVAGVPEFLACAADYPELKLYGGVELSTDFCNREVHIVGLGIDHTNTELADYLENMRRERINRAEKMAARLASLGYPIPDEEWRGLKVVGRMHFAKSLFNHYHFNSLDDIFALLLRRGRPAYVRRELPSVEAAINIIHTAGGAAIWAHPIFAMAGERAWLRRSLKRMVPAGLDGIEAHYACFTPQQTEMVLEFAEQNRLIPSGGSDFHSAGAHNTEVGSGRGDLAVPAAIVPLVDERILEIRAARKE